MRDLLRKQFWPSQSTLVLRHILRKSRSDGAHELHVKHDTDPENRKGEGHRSSDLLEDCSFDREKEQNQWPIDGICILTAMLSSLVHSFDSPMRTSFSTPVTKVPRGLCGEWHELISRSNAITNRSTSHRFGLPACEATD